jgi:hypothetical protein
MSLGVLNNLSAMYAENNLNNTTNSLNTVLQQLSSGSKINSGADDAAGLSLVDGLQANSMALAQSQTNAQEGVGLLQVADGALSQVTSLLNRAVTLATEASNGTLNSRRIRLPIRNTSRSCRKSRTSVPRPPTTAGGLQLEHQHLHRRLFDSRRFSRRPEHPHALFVQPGRHGGTMAYSSGSNNVFVDLSNGGVNAASTDSLGASTATTTLPSAT